MVVEAVCSRSEVHKVDDHENEIESVDEGATEDLLLADTRLAVHLSAHVLE